jgi:hypothetical protein
MPFMTEDEVRQFLATQDQLMIHAEELGRIYQDVYWSKSRHQDGLCFDSIDDDWILLSYYAGGENNNVTIPTRLLWSDNPRLELLAQKEEANRQAAEKKRQVREEQEAASEAYERATYEKLKAKFGEQNG